MERGSFLVKFLINPRYAYPASPKPYRERKHLYVVNADRWLRFAYIYRTRIHPFEPIARGKSSLVRKMCPGFRGDVSSISNNPGKGRSIGYSSTCTYRFDQASVRPTKQTRRGSSRPIILPPSALLSPLSSLALLMERQCVFVSSIVRPSILFLCLLFDQGRQL